MTTHPLSERDEATILAALWTFQAMSDGMPAEVEHEATCGGKFEIMSHDEIEALSARIKQRALLAQIPDFASSDPHLYFISSGLPDGERLDLFVRAASFFEAQAAWMNYWFQKGKIPSNEGPRPDHDVILIPATGTVGALPWDEPGGPTVVSSEYTAETQTPYDAGPGTN